MSQLSYFLPYPSLFLTEQVNKKLGWGVQFLRKAEKLEFDEEITCEMYFLGHCFHELLHVLVV